MARLLLRVVMAAQAAWRAFRNKRAPQGDGDGRAALIANLTAMR